MKLEVERKRYEESAVNEEEYPYEYYHAQAVFAKKWSKVTGIPITDVFEGYTSLPYIFPNDSTGAMIIDPWDGIELREGPSLVARRIHAHYSNCVNGFHYEKNVERIDSVTGEIFSCDYVVPSSMNDWNAQVHVHFIGIDRGKQTVLRADRTEERQREIGALIRRAHERWPEATRVKGESWLYGLPTYRASFPPEYVQTMKPLTVDGYESQFPGSEAGIDMTNDSVWGQFVNRYGWVRSPVYEDFLAKLAKARSPKAVLSAFPCPTYRLDAPIEVFAQWGMNESLVKTS